MYGSTQTMIRNIASSVAPQIRNQNHQLQQNLILHQNDHLQHLKHNHQPQQMSLKSTKQKSNRKIKRTHTYRLPTSSTNQKPKEKTIRVCLLDCDEELRGDSYRYELEEVVSIWICSLDSE